MRIIGYARVSTEEQAESGLGIEAQVAQLRRQCELRDWQLISLIRDDGYTAKTLERPGLRRALTVVAAGGADGIMVVKLDRLTRSVIDFGLLIEWFAELDATLVALDLGVDTSTPAGHMVANVMVSVAEWERDVIAERTRLALAALRARGQQIGRPAVADKPELAERIRSMREDGMTLQAIADTLNTEGIPTLRGAREWRVSSVQSAAGYRRPKPRRRPAALPEPRARRASTASR